MVEVENYLLDNKELRIIQRKDMFNFSLDTVLLSHFAFISQKSKMVIDFGTNNAAIPLILSQLSKSSIIGVEIQEEAYQLACKNIKINNLEQQVKLVNQDIKEFVEHFQGHVDSVICNPPFFKVGEKSNLNENEYLAIARHEIKITLEEIIISAAKLLNQGGRLSMIHRPERLIEIIDLMKKYKIEPKRLRLVYPKLNTDANMILIEGVYQGRSGLKIESPLIAHNENGDYSDEVKRMFLGESK